LLAPPPSSQGLLLPSQPEVNFFLF
jgi:hypothetical protein